jgi:hypothetical protein
VTAAGRRSPRFSQPNAPYLFQRPEAAITWRVRDIPRSGMTVHCRRRPSVHIHTRRLPSQSLQRALSSPSSAQVAADRRGGGGCSVTVSAMPRWMFCARRRPWPAGSVRVVRAPAGMRIRGSPQRPAGCQPCLRSASALSPAARIMAALGAEPQLRVRRKSSGRTRRRSSISCCGSHRRSSTRAQKRAW